MVYKWMGPPRLLLVEFVYRPVVRGLYFNDINTHAGKRVNEMVCFSVCLRVSPTTERPFYIDRDFSFAIGQKNCRARASVAVDKERSRRACRFVLLR